MEGFFLFISALDFMAAGRIIELSLPDDRRHT
jgi:hypothetical protein